ncbi:hypothetical protein [Cupriavidus nantongensis]|uniref:hypothetical protein n=1 Tax=Cupriavidus nantongensis TaxID=1796606 RepID=UPI0012379A8E|nr:hypothetical protein [Cupriavidus nantongensis]
MSPLDAARARTSNDSPPMTSIDSTTMPAKDSVFTRERLVVVTMGDRARFDVIGIPAKENVSLLTGETYLSKSVEEGEMLVLFIHNLAGTAAR